MLKIMVLDDDPRQINTITTILEKEFDEIIVDTASSIEEIDRKRNIKEYDLYLLDIEVGEESGLDYGISIRDTNQLVEIIFITSHDRFALKGYEARPLGYLLKPVDKEKLVELIQSVQEKIRERVLIKLVENYNTIYIYLDEIIAVTSNEGKTEIKVRNDSYEVNKSLKKIQEEWGPAFIPINRNTLVNSIYIKSIDTASEVKTLSLTDGSRYSFGERYFNNFYNALMESESLK